MILIMIDPSEKGSRAIIEVKPVNDDEFQAGLKELVEDNLQDPLPEATMKLIVAIDLSVPRRKILEAINKQLKRDESSDYALEVHEF